MKTVQPKPKPLMEVLVAKFTDGQCPARFTLNGIEHKQVKRSGNVAIYQLYTLAPDSKTTFDVVLIVNELYPSWQDWGIRGWTYNLLREAEDKFKVEVYLAETE